MKPTSSIRTTKLQGGRSHFTPCKNAGERTHRFNLIQQALLNAELLPLLPEHRLIVCAISLEAIVSFTDLTNFLGATKNVVRADESFFVSWKAPDGRIERRQLHALTRISIENCKHIEDWPAAIKTFENYRIQARYADKKNSFRLPTLREFLLDSEAWLFEVLPLPLYSHAKGAHPIAALPDSAWARLAARFPIAPTTQDEDRDGTNDSLAACVFDAIIDAPFTANGAWFISLLKTAVSSGGGMSNAEGRSRILAQLTNIAPDCAYAGPTAALLMGWVVNMLLFGTPNTAIGNPSTVKKYFLTIADQLHSAFTASQKHLLDHSVEELEKLYLDLASSQTSNDVVQAALNAFHGYLVDEFDFKPLYLQKGGNAQSLPKANVLWPHEALQVRRLLAAADDSQDPRFLEQCAAMFEIGHALRLRIGEVLALRMRSVRPIGNVLEIEIAPRLSDKQLKTPGSRRILTVDCDIARNSILTWHQRRLDEAALNDDYLFGDPFRPRSLYRFGQSRTLLNRLLKIVTGDRTACFHMLRHGVSFDLEAVLCDNSSMEISPIDMLASKMGHTTSQTIFHSYFHIYEKPLRHAIDRKLSEHAISIQGVASWTGMNAAALRQKIHRSTRAKEDLLREVIHSAAGALPCRTYLENFSFGEPLHGLPWKTARTFCFDMVLKVLRDIASGIPAASVSLRNVVSQKTVEEIATHALQLCAPIFLDKKAFRSLPRHDVLLTLTALFADSMLPDISRCEQAKFAGVRRYLEKKSPASFFAVWSRSVENGYLGLFQKDDIRVTIGFLADCNVSPSNILIRTDLSEKNSLISLPHPLRRDATALALARDMAEIDAIFHAAYGVLPRAETVSPHTGRPSRYLIITDQFGDDSKHVASAASSMDGFNALLMAAMTYAKMDSLVTASEGATTHA